MQTGAAEGLFCGEANTKPLQDALHFLIESGKPEPMSRCRVFMFRSTQRGVSPSSRKNHLMTNELFRLVYRSDALILLDNMELLDTIFEVSVRNNKRDNITGALAVPGGKFVQVLEGSDAKLFPLMERIQADNRHENVSVLGKWPIQARLFDGWAMARPDPTPLSEQSFGLVVENGTGAQVTSIFLRLLKQTDNRFRPH